MRFQTKLMLAFILATTLVSFAVIQLTGHRVKRSYTKQFESRFDKYVEYLLETRDDRSDADRERATELADHAYVRRVLGAEKAARRKVLSDQAAKKAFFDKAQIGQEPKTEGPNGRAPGLQGSIFGVMDLNGEVSLFNGPEVNNRATGRQKARRQKNNTKRLESLKSDSRQQIAYLPRNNPNSEEMRLREIIISPVTDPESKQPLGAMLLGLPNTENPAQQALDLYHQKLGAGNFVTTTFYDGQFYFPAGRRANPSDDNSDAIMLEGIAAETEAMLDSLPEGKTRGDFETTIESERHMVHYCALNPDSPMETAWQISVYPLKQLEKDLSELRLVGSGIGLVGALLGWIASWFLARNLAVPISDLTSGTRRVREGVLDTELKVRSKDELGELTQAFNLMTSELRQKRRYRELLEKVSDESVARAMIEGTLNPMLGGELKEVSVLFCDIRGFTNLTETMRPEEVIDLLNIHMTAMANVVRDHQGVVDKFVGDEIMALFGGLKSSGSDATNAARCALRMIEERNRINRETNQNIQIGVGLATGEMVAGCMGSEDRLNYTVLGARVNLGARLCSHANGGEVVIDDITFNNLTEAKLKTEPIVNLELKGFQSGVSAWKLSAGEA